MPTCKLTDFTIKNLKPDTWWDIALPGFGIRIGSNRKTWLCRYRQGGKQLKRRLGFYPIMSLQAARKAFAEISQRIDSGLRPTPPEAHPRSADAVSLRSLIDHYERLRRKEGRNIKTLDEGLRKVRIGLADYLDMPARQFTKSDLRAARDAASERGRSVGDHLLRYYGPIARWGAEEDLIPTNFVPDIRKSPPKARSRVLTPTEIARIWQACDGDSLGENTSANAFARMVRFLLCVGCRRDEAATLKHGDILDTRWRQTDNKSGRPHTLRLPPLAREIVGMGEAHELVFSGVTGGKISGYSKLKARLDQRSGVRGWWLHDCRRSMASYMQELGIPNPTISAVLNHKLMGVAGIYMRSELEAQKADALERWNAELERIVHTARIAVS